MDRAAGYAWEIQDLKGDWVLCQWSEPTRSALLRGGKPSNEARIVNVQLVRSTDLNRMLKRKCNERER